MRVIADIRQLKAGPIRGSVVAVGVFDGVHLGHQKLLMRVIRRARALGLASVVVTFDPHPLAILDPSIAPPILISLKHRVRLIKELGVDVVVILRFTRSIASLSPREFVEKILVKGCGMKEVCAGSNFYFGRGAKAGVSVLKGLSAAMGFKAAVIEPVKFGGQTVSSSIIRDLIERGKLSLAGRLLGRPVSVLGTVVRGARIGRVLGYPTANIDPHHEVIPPSGVYAVEANCAGARFKGVLNIGARPTFRKRQSREPVIEAHLFNFRGNIYGKDLEISFVKRLRAERPFKDRQELIRQIRKDSARAIKIFTPLEKGAFSNGVYKKV